MPGSIGNYSDSHESYNRILIPFPTFGIGKYSILLESGTETEPRSGQTMLSDLATSSLFVLLCMPFLRLTQANGE